MTPRCRYLTLILAIILTNCTVYIPEKSYSNIQLNGKIETIEKVKAKRAWSKLYKAGLYGSLVGGVGVATYGSIVNENENPNDDTSIGGIGLLTTLSIIPNMIIANRYVKKQAARLKPKHLPKYLKAINKSKSHKLVGHTKNGKYVDDIAIIEKKYFDVNFKPRSFEDRAILVLFNQTAMKKYLKEQRTYEFELYGDTYIWEGLTIGKSLEGDGFLYRIESDNPLVMQSEFFENTMKGRFEVCSKDFSLSGSAENGRVKNLSIETKSEAYVPNKDKTSISKNKKGEDFLEVILKNF